MVIAVALLKKCVLGYCDDDGFQLPLHLVEARQAFLEQGQDARAAVLGEAREAGGLLLRWRVHQAARQRPGPEELRRRLAVQDHVRT